MTSDRNPLDPFVRILESRAELASSDRAAILDLPHTIQTFEPSTYLIREGEQPGPCAILASGFAYRHKMTGEGARQILAIHIPGEALDLQHLFLDEADHNVQALTRSEVALIPRSAIRDLMSARPAVAQAIITNMLVDASISREWIANIGRRDARARIAHLLCEFAVRLDAQGSAEPDGYTLPMTQEQIGDATGLTAVHVNRMLKSLVADGVVVINRRSVQFPNWPALRDVADFVDRYLHLSKPNGTSVTILSRL